MVICPSCGEKLPDNSKFCFKCGSKINIEETNQTFSNDDKDYEKIIVKEEKSYPETYSNENNNPNILDNAVNTIGGIISFGKDVASNASQEIQHQQELLHQEQKRQRQLIYNFLESEDYTKTLQEVIPKEYHGTIKQEIMNRKFIDNDEAINYMKERSIYYNQLIDEKKNNELINSFLDSEDCNETLENNIPKIYREGIKLEISNRKFIENDEAINYIVKRGEILNKEIEDKYNDYTNNGFIIQIDQEPNGLINVYSNNVIDLVGGEIVNSAFNEVTRWADIKVLIYKDGFIFNSMFIPTKDIIVLQLAERKTDVTRFRILLRNGSNYRIGIKNVDLLAILKIFEENNIGTI